MTTLVNKSKTTKVSAVSVRFVEAMLYIRLSDGREIGVPLDHYKWLAHATPDQKLRWTIEPTGFAVYWEELDDGIELVHLLDEHPLE